MPTNLIRMGQKYIGTLSRHCLPLDSDPWWNEMGSYEIKILTVGSSLLTYHSFRVHRDGRRELIQEATAFREVRLSDFQKDMTEGIFLLRQENAPEQSADHE